MKSSVDDVLRWRVAGRNRITSGSTGKPIAHRRLNKPSGNALLPRLCGSTQASNSASKYGKRQQIRPARPTLVLRRGHRPHQARQNRQPQRHHPGAVDQHQQRGHGKHRQAQVAARCAFRCAPAAATAETDRNAPAEMPASTPPRHQTPPPRAGPAASTPASAPAPPA